MAGELSFPSAEECDSTVTPTRHVTVPVTFEDVMQYRQVFKAALRGELIFVAVIIRHNCHFSFYTISSIRIIVSSEFTIEESLGGGCSAIKSL